MSRPGYIARLALLCLAMAASCSAPKPVEVAEPALPAAGPDVTTVEVIRVPLPEDALPVTPPPSVEIVEIANFGDKLATSTAVSKAGRKFVSFPRWFKDNEAPQSVAELLPDGSLKPFPDAAWNSWKAGDKVVNKLVCVQSVLVDAFDRLWILDAGAPYFGKVLKGAPKLVAIDLANDRVVNKIDLNGKIAPESAYLNDVRVDPNGDFAYLSDSNLGHIVVVNLMTGESRLALDGDASTKREEGVVPTVEGVVSKQPDGNAFKVNVDGIAIAGGYLYYHAAAGKTMYRIKRAVLRDPKLKPAAVAAAVEKVAETGIHDGIAGDGQGNVYLTQVEQNGIKVLRANGTQELIVSDPRLQWPDSIRVGVDGLYVTVSQLHLLPLFNGGKSARVNPYRVFRIKPVGFAAK